MSPFGYRLARRRNRRYGTWDRLLRNTYALWVGTGDLHGLVRCPPLARRLDPNARRVGDLGCGSGPFHQEALLRFKFKGLVVGLDEDFQALRTAQRTAEECGVASSIRYLCASAERLPFRDGVFDQLFMVDLLEHLREDSAALAEGGRVLRENGLLEVSTPTPLYPRVFGGRIHRAVGHVRPGYSSRTLSDRLESAGFSVTHVSKNTGCVLWFPMALWYRIGWGLWSPGEKSFVVKMLYRSMLAFLSLWAHAGRRIDLFGGYCSNDVQARRKRACRAP